MTPALMLIALIGAHMLADHPLQGEFLALGKNAYKPDPRIHWAHAMLAHVTIHGAFVALITGVWWLFFLEAFMHAVTDDCKCEGTIGYTGDLVIHLACKLVWWGIAVYCGCSAWVIQ